MSCTYNVTAYHLSVLNKNELKVSMGHFIDKYISDIALQLSFECYNCYNLTFIPDNHVAF